MIPEEWIQKIEAADRESMEAARQRWLTIAKPLFSLGKLEDTVVKLAGIKRTADVTLGKKALLIMCADNGVVEEGVTQTGQEVTAFVADNFTKGKTSVCVMCNYAGVDLFPVDVGMASDVPSVTDPGQKVMYGTKNFRKERAMTRTQVLQAMEVGIRAAETCVNKGYGILATGEMGIGNTTTSSAVASVLLDRPVEEVTGRGAGLSSQGLDRKIRIIREAIAMHRPDPSDVTDVLSKVGGLDIAGLTGIFLGGAMFHVPVVVDGFISAVAALCAVRMKKETADYLIPSHVSKEPAGAMLLEALSLSPVLHCDMCLGEGTGAVAAIPLIEMGLRVYREMTTFDQEEFERYEVLT